jgi:hypothetical protein
MAQVTAWGADLIAPISKPSYLHINQLRFALNYLEYRVTAMQNGDIGLGKVPTTKLDVSGSLNIENNITASGNTVLLGILDTTGATVFRDNVIIQKQLTVSGIATFGNDLQIAGKLVMIGGASTQGALTANGAATLSNTLNVGGATTMSSSLSVAGATNIAGALTASQGLIVNAGATLNGGTNNTGSLTVGGAFSVAQKAQFSYSGGPSFEVGSSAVVPSLNADMLDGAHLADLLRAMWPIGAIYLSVNNTDPSTTIGGAWTAFAPGRFLLGAGGAWAVGFPGGSSTVALTEANLPAHTHTYNSPTYEKRPTWQTWNDPVSSPGAVPTQTGACGSGVAHDNMPPYLVVYMWQRTG